VRQEALEWRGSAANLHYLRCSQNLVEAPVQTQVPPIMSLAPADYVAGSAVGTMQAEESEGFVSVQNYQMLVSGIWKPIPKMYRYLASVCWPSQLKRPRRCLPEFGRGPVRPHRWRASLAGCGPQSGWSTTTSIPMTMGGSMPQVCRRQPCAV
jgi:hypothetical protein